MTKMSNSSLVIYTQISPNRSSPRNHVIDTIAIHCMAGHLSLRACGDLFAKSSTGASSNYGINDDGEVGLFVDERDRSWCTSSRDVDNRAVTIEVASDANGACKVTDAALASTIKLCADICKRNNIKKLVWSWDKNDRVNHLKGCNMEVHRDHDSKACPGDYLYDRMGYIASEVNKILTAGIEPNLVVDGIDYSKVYNYDFYTNKYADVKKAFESDKQSTFDHFLNHGMKEARQGNEDFILSIYKSNYPDLRAAFGEDLPKYYQHYVTNGIKEKRVATYHITPISVYDGVDYSLVYDGAYYRNKYKDLQDAFGDNYDKYIAHFVKNGMKEHRQAIATFNVDIYRANYPDLQAAFGDDMPAYYMHYITHGYKEGRVADKRIQPTPVYHAYTPGESIADIAKKYNISIDTLLALNNIKFSKGQKIRIK